MVVVLLALAAAAFGTNAGATPGGWTQAQVNASIMAAVAYIDTQQNPDGSFGTTFPETETGMSLVAYGVLANGNFSSLSPAYQTHVKKAIVWLLSKQVASPVGGAEWDDGGRETYGTGIVLAGLSPFTTVNPGVPAAITAGRTFLVNEFQGPVYTGCNSSDGSPTSDYCGGWDYDHFKESRSDESNSGFAMFGLRETGGVPAAIVPDNINWNHHIQTIASNPFSSGTGHNDGGGSYQPACVAQGCQIFESSNANDTGTMLFSYGYDGVPAADPHVVAGLKLGQDVLDVYELAQPTDNMVFHTGANEDGSCLPGSGTCDWQFSAPYNNNEGGFHYSLFSLTKGLGQYIAPSLTDPTNWYAKVVDLLLSQQQGDGSWPVDGRDDGSVLFATALGVGSLGLVGVPPVEGCALDQPQPAEPFQLNTVAYTGPGLSPFHPHANYVKSIAMEKEVFSCVLHGQHSIKDVETFIDLVDIQHGGQMVPFSKSVREAACVKAVEAGTVTCGARGIPLAPPDPHALKGCTPLPANQQPAAPVRMKTVSVGGLIDTVKAEKEVWSCNQQGTVLADVYLFTKSVENTSPITPAGGSPVTTTFDGIACMKSVPTAALTSCKQIKIGVPSP